MAGVPVLVRGEAMVGALVFAANEEAAVARTIAGLGWARQIVVVDAGSTDDTASRAARAGARVVGGGELEAGLGVIDAPWVLLVGGSEVVSAELARRVARAAQGRPRPYRVRSSIEFRGGRVRLPASVRLAPRAGLRVRVGALLLPELVAAGTARRLRGGLCGRPYADLGGAVERLDVLSSAMARTLGRQRRGRGGGFLELAVRPPAAAMRLMLGCRGSLVPALTVVALEAYRVAVTLAKLWELRRAMQVPPSSESHRAAVEASQ